MLTNRYGKMWMMKRNKNVVIDKKAELGKRVLLDTHAGGKIIIGRSYFGDYVKLHAAGGMLKIGNDVTIGAFGFVNAAGNVTIDDHVLCADKVNIVAENHGYADINIPIRKQRSIPGEIKIGEGSWLGINVTILAGTTIGKNCVVGANSVVKGHYDDFCVIAGNPARVVKRYDGKEWVKVK